MQQDVAEGLASVAGAVVNVIKKANEDKTRGR